MNIVTENHLRTVVYIVTTAGETIRFPEDVATTCLGCTDDFKERCHG